jgi:hypothetical protein
MTPNIWRYAGVGVFYRGFIGMRLLGYLNLSADSPKELAIHIPKFLQGLNSILNYCFKIGYEFLKSEKCRRLNKQTEEKFSVFGDFGFHFGVIRRW